MSPTATESKEDDGKPTSSSSMTIPGGRRSKRIPSSVTKTDEVTEGDKGKVKDVNIDNGDDHNAQKVQKIHHDIEKYTLLKQKVDIHPSQLQNFMYRDEDDKLYTMDVNASSLRPPLLAKNTNGMLRNILGLKNSQVSDMQTFDSDRPRFFAVRLQVRSNCVRIIFMISCMN